MLRRPAPLNRAVLEDPQRLAAIDATGLLERDAHPALERIARMVTRVTGAPVALVSIVGTEEQVFAGAWDRTGAAAGVRSTPLSHSFCAGVVSSGLPVVIADARGDATLSEHPAVTESGVGAYAGVPLRAPGGELIGALCAIDRERRDWTGEDVAALSDLAEGAVALIALEDANARSVRSARRLADAQTLARVAGWTWHLDGNRIEASPELSLVFAPGRPPGGDFDAWLELFWPADAARLRRDIRRAMQTGADEVSGEYGLADGEDPARTIALRGELERDRTGRVVRAEGVVQDVTPSRRALTLLQATFDATADAIVAVEGRRVVACNDRLRALLGVPADAEVDLAALRSAVRRSLVEPQLAIDLYNRGTAEPGTELRAEMRTRDGRVLECFSAASGRSGRVWSFRDVTERVRAAEELAVQARHLAEAQALAGIGSFDFDVEADAAIWSEELYRIFGVDPSAFRPSVAGVLERVHPEDRERIEAVLGQAMKAGRPLELEGRILREDGEVRTIVAQAEVFRDEHGRLRMRGTMQDVTRRRRAEEELRRLATHDPLTGLPNRQLLADRVERARGRLSGEASLAVVHLNLDRFTAVNQRFGQEAGDAALVALAGRLRATAAGTDTVARVSGDEFVVLREGLAGEHEALALAERLLAAAAEPFAHGEHELTLRASAGVAVLEAGAAAGDPVRDAATAVHRAKARGGATVELFDAALRERVTGRLRLEQELRRALADGQLRLHYQPIVGVAEGEVTALEALMRWQHPERGLLSPAEFIPVAEESDLIVHLGRWALEEACRQVTRWAAEHPDRVAPRVSVNVAARQLSAPGFAEEVAAVLRETGADPASVVLEITETMVLEAAGVDAAAVLEALKELGVNVVLDDFGTGYSSLSYVARLPIDGVKIDRSFVGRLTENDADSAIVEAILGMSRTLGLSTVAEGVEHESQARALTDMGCRLAQGYLFARPAPAGDLAGLLADKLPVR